MTMTMTTEQIDIDIVHTGSDEHVLTAYDRDGHPICSLLAPDQDVVGDIVEGIDGERTATLATVTIPLSRRHRTGRLHAALYHAAAAEWPIDGK